MREKKRNEFKSVKESDSGTSMASNKKAKKTVQCGLHQSFTKIKFGNVYREAKDLFESLNDKYPNKHDLTKTREYKLWKNDILNGDDDTDGSEKESEDESASEGEPQTAGGQSVNEKQPEKPENKSDSEVEPEKPENKSDSEGEPEKSEDKSANEADDEADEVDNGVDILQIAAQDFLPFSPEINDLDDRIDQIIQELQQDNDLRDYLNAERNGELVQDLYEDEDEGIGLNVDTELQAILEPFDYELEVEGEDW